MDLKGKKVIIIGERDGIQGPAIAECIKSAGAEPVLVQTQCFVWTAAGALDQDGQQGIKNIYDQYQSRSSMMISEKGLPAALPRVLTDLRRSASDIGSTAEWPGGAGEQSISNQTLNDLVTLINWFSGKIWIRIVWYSIRYSQLNGRKSPLL